MLSIVICDNNLTAVEQMKDMLARKFSSGEYRVYSFQTKDALKQAVLGGLIPDIALIDVWIKSESGIELAKNLFSGKTHTQVIFVTSYREHYTEVYEAEHVYFLLKPVDYREFQRAMDKAIVQLKERAEKFLVLKTRGTILRIAVDSICYIESVGRKITVHCREGSYEHYASLSSVISQLPDYFVQCHKSFCVNMNDIRRLEPRHLFLSNGTEIPISQTKKYETREIFSEFLTARL